MNYVDPAITPYYGNYTSANFCYTENTMLNKNNGIAYLENNSGGLYIEGFVGNLQDTAHHLIKEYVTPHSKVMSWPSTYGTTYGDNYTITAHAGWDLFGHSYDSIKIKNIITSTCDIDAWGSMQTPLATYPNTLRQKRHKYETDSTWAHQISPSTWIFLATTKDTLDSYSWWTNTVGIPVVEMDFKATTNKASNVKWLYNTPTLGIAQEVEMYGFAAYPNPANNSITIKVKDNNAYTISVYDIAGKQMELEKQSITNSITINTENLDAGLYFVVLTYKEGSRNVKKISIAH